MTTTATEILVRSAWSDGLLHLVAGEHTGYVCTPSPWTSEIEVQPLSRFAMTVWEYPEVVCPACADAVRMLWVGAVRS